MIDNLLNIFSDICEKLNISHIDKLYLTRWGWHDIVNSTNAHDRVDINTHLHAINHGYLGTMFGIQIICNYKIFPNQEMIIKPREEWNVYLRYDYENRKFPQRVCGVKNHTHFMKNIQRCNECMVQSIMES